MDLYDNAALSSISCNSRKKSVSLTLPESFQGLIGFILNATRLKNKLVHMVQIEYTFCCRQNKDL